MQSAAHFSKRKVFQGSFLVGGTAIGAGMLALPIATAQAGFVPALVVYVVCWLFSLITGLLMLEISLVMPKDANLISMSKRFLGPVGKSVAWLLYLFLFYSLTLAYITGGGSMVSSLLFPESHHGWGMLLFTLVFGGVVLAGHHAVNRVNVALMLGLVLFYAFFVGIGAEKVEVNQLKYFDFRYAAFALPIVFTSFSYQGVIPSLVSYLGKNRKMGRLAIICGSTIPFLIYIVWDLLIKGIIPLDGVYGLLQARESGGIAIEPLQHFFPGAPLTMIGKFFAFFAVATSFLGVTMGLLDFLADGIGVKKGKANRIWLWLLVFAPPFAIGVIDPSIFFTALKYAGGIGCVLLLGMLPTLMVWTGRYRKESLALPGEVRGGRFLLVLLILFMIFEVGLTLRDAL